MILYTSGNQLINIWLGFFLKFSGNMSIPCDETTNLERMTFKILQFDPEPQPWIISYYHGLGSYLIATIFMVKNTVHTGQYKLVFTSLTSSWNMNRMISLGLVWYGLYCLVNFQEISKSVWDCKSTTQY